MGAAKVLGAVEEDLGREEAVAAGGEDVVFVVAHIVCLGQGWEVRLGLLIGKLEN